MIDDIIGKKISWLLASSLFLVTVFVTPNFSIDPINVPKLWILTTLSFAILALMLTQTKIISSKNNLPIIVVTISVPLLMLIAMLISNAPFEQQFFGVNGRNTGLLAYICFSILFIAATQVKVKTIVKPLVIAACAAFGINAVYGFLQAAGKDPVKWVNPYSPVIGTLGNPDFSSALLGMGTAFAFSFLVSSKSYKTRIICILYIILSWFDMIKSDAQQGIIISLLSIYLVTFIKMHSVNRNRFFQISYLLFGGISSLLAILGSLNKGPLASILHKPSVIYRGDYWHAAFNIIKEHPIFGIGLDSFGDWYRSARSLSATLRRGPGVTSNAVHNVFLDITSTAGIFALIAYLLIIFFGFKSAWNIFKKENQFNPLFTSIFVVWIGYLVQSIISINNLALGIWGWILPGILISIEKEKFAKIEKLDIRKEIASNKKRTDFSGMLAIFGLVLGGIIGYMPFKADTDFRHAMEIGDANMIQKAALKWPKNTDRMIYAAQIFDKNGYPDRALKITRDITKYNPRNYAAWVYVFNAKSTSADEKKKILQILKQLDPNNPELK